jgi:hypothetical protein
MKHEDSHENLQVIYINMICFAEFVNFRYI